MNNTYYVYRDLLYLQCCAKPLVCMYNYTLYMYA